MPGKTSRRTQPVKEPVLADVEPSSLINVLQFIKRENHIGGGKTSLKVDDEWISDNLKGKDERTGLPAERSTQENRPEKTTPNPNDYGIDPTLARPLDDGAEEKDPKQLIQKIVLEINEGSGWVGPSGLGVGPELSTLLEEIAGVGKDVDPSSSSKMRGEQDADGPRGGGQDGAEADGMESNQH